ncbi:hypothetical protein KY328_02170 [Candidatus Woesearchaeota archaeon]|nr:hypothetical protein [Candidatus Woesearchaeota archaeon]MBW3021700.1 hypothetical protein [Candidatus Woesearchaeota archaeon]
MKSPLNSNLTSLTFRVILKNHWTNLMSSAGNGESKGFKLSTNDLASHWTLDRYACEVYK